MVLENNFDFNDIFEQKLCDYTGFKYAVTVDCCTNAILISLEALRLKGKINKEIELDIPFRTYMSVPMTLKHNGWKISFIENKWEKKYQIGNTSIYDSATDFHQDMSLDYSDDVFVCVSFQQKKRLSLGRGGAILFNDIKYLEILRRLRHDGRNSKMCDKDEIEYNLQDILIGYHCYLEPDKAAKGILIMNQHQLMLKPYSPATYKDYPDLRKLNWN